MPLNVSRAALLASTVPSDACSASLSAGNELSNQDTGPLHALTQALCAKSGPSYPRNASVLVFAEWLNVHNEPSRVCTEPLNACNALLHANNGSLHACKGLLHASGQILSTITEPLKACSASLNASAEPFGAYRISLTEYTESSNACRRSLPEFHMLVHANNRSLPPCDALVDACGVTIIARSTRPNAGSEALSGSIGTESAGRVSVDGCGGTSKGILQAKRHPSGDPPGATPPATRPGRR